VAAQFDSQVRLITDSPDRLARLVLAASQLRQVSAGLTPASPTAPRVDAAALTFFERLGFTATPALAAPSTAAALPAAEAAPAQGVLGDITTAAMQPKAFDPLPAVRLPADCYAVKRPALRSAHCS